MICDKELRALKPKKTRICSFSIRSLQTKAEKMVQEQLTARHRGIAHPEVIAAMRQVPREIFVPDACQLEAYSDRPLSIGHGQTISQPFIVAYMTESILSPSVHRVLEIGTGSGYQTAVLAEIVQEVFTIEIVPSLAKEARARLGKLGYANIRFLEGNGYEGWPGGDSFDAIMLTCAPPFVPERILKQLGRRGRLVLPAGTERQRLLRITRVGDGFHREELLPVRFVPMLDEPGEP